MTRKHLGFTSKTVHRQSALRGGDPHQTISGSVAPGFGNVNDLNAIFQGAPGDVYSRQSNPTIRSLEDQLTEMEEGIGTVAFSTGMAAIGSTMLALLRAGDHIVSSSFLFGNTDSLFKTFQRLGISVTFVDVTDVANVMVALKPETRLVFTETIANPRTQVADLAAIGELCKARGIVYIVDNTMTSPVLFSPRDVGASLVINSLTKYIAGHGAVLGGAVTDVGNFNWSNFPGIDERYKKGDPVKWGLLQIRKLGLRDFGATLSPEAAHHIALGAETLALRMEKICDNALALAIFLSEHAKVARVYYPGLEHHPQFTRARELFAGAGGLLALELVDGIDCCAFLNRLEMVVKSSNLGDTRTLAIPAALTIYHEMGPERRASMGIADSLIRVSVGIEDKQDLIDDFRQALA